MIHKLIELSLRHRGLILVLYLALALLGYWALIRTPVDAIPDLSDNQVIVFTDWVGRSPQEVEDQVTYPLVTNLQKRALKRRRTSVCRWRLSRLPPSSPSRAWRSRSGGGVVETATEPDGLCLRRAPSP